MTAAIGTLAKAGIGATSSVDKPLQFESESFSRKDEAYNGNALRGTFSSSIELVRDGIQRIDGVISLIPTAVELSTVLAWILAGTPTGSGTVTYPLADTALPTKYLSIDRVAQVFNYTGVAVDKATFSAARGTNLKLDLDLVGQTETAASAGTFPVLTLDVTTLPFVLTDAALTIGGTSVQAFDVKLEINNHIDRDRYLFSKTLSAINRLDREINFSCNLPYGDYVAIYTAMTAGPTAVPVVLTFTVGGSVLTFTMPAVSVPKRTPNVPGRSEIILPWGGRALKSGSTFELTTTLNNGP